MSHDECDQQTSVLGFRKRKERREIRFGSLQKSVHRLRVSEDLALTP